MAENIITKTWGCLIMLMVAGLCFSDFSIASGAESPKLGKSDHKILYQARRAIGKTRYEKAKRLLEAHIDRREEKVDYRIFFLLGNVYSMQEAPLKALAAYKKATAIYDADPAVWQNMGKACFSLERFSRAGSHMEQAWLMQENKDPALLFQAAGGRLTAGETRKAYELLERLCNRNPEGVKLQWLESFAYACMELGKTNKALQTVHRLLERQPDEPRWWRMLTNTYIRKKAFNRAAAALEIHNRLVPEKKENVIRLGDIYTAAGVPFKAAVQYERAFEWVRTSRHYQKTAQAYMAAHRLEKAAGILKQALEIEPSACLWHMLGTVRYNQDKPDKAYQAFQKSHKLEPGKGRTLLLMGYSALKAGRYQPAVAAFEKACAYKNQKQAARQGLTAVRAAGGSN
ncbi:MAG: tetratricopeptide repeat protein [Thermodesulfobacteriota bacterium]